MTEYEIERVEDRIGGLSPEEQIVAVEKIDTDILWDELRKRETRERNFQKAMQDMVKNA